MPSGVSCERFDARYSSTMYSGLLQESSSSLVTLAAGRDGSGRLVCRLSHECQTATTTEKTQIATEKTILYLTISHLLSVYVIRIAEHGGVDGLGIGLFEPNPDESDNLHNKHSPTDQLEVGLGVHVQDSQKPENDRHECDDPVNVSLPHDSRPPVLFGTAERS